MAKKNSEAANTTALARRELYQQIIHNNATDDEMLKVLKEHFNITNVNTAKSIITSTKHRLKGELKKLQHKAAEIQSDRLNAIIDLSWEKGDWKTVLKAMDQLNKIYGLYQDVNINNTQVNGENIQIAFV